MSVIGSSERWRTALADMYDIIREAISRVWPACKAKVAIAEPESPDAHEDPITRSLIMYLRRDPIIRDSPVVVCIGSQWEILPEDPQADPKPIGYLDICLLFVTGADKLYLAMECKRLNVVRANNRRATRAYEYVEDGMMRFVRGQYSSDLPLGAMVGYVMDGDVETAYAAVRRQIKRHAQHLLCVPALFHDVKRPEHFSTAHQRPHVPIELRHLLLAAR